MDKEEKIELAKEILTLAGITTLFITAVIAPPAAAGFAKLYFEYKKYNRSNKWHYRGKVKRTIKNLEDRGLVVTESRGEEILIKLTQAGKKWLKRQEILKMTIPRSKQWDGLWRVVVFDIAEADRPKRQVLRGWLRRLGFARLQKSVWVIPWSCKRQFELLAAELKLGNQAILLETKIIAKEKALRKIFKF